ncbi:MAG: hydrogenase expression/formation protein HypE [Pseudomonadales bacterium]|nr:hydrogenase expression/formation protein HypE [Pseudomonadales bacterium]
MTAFSPYAPLDIKHGKVNMAHGSGGRTSAQLIEHLFKKHLGNELLNQNNDQALFEIGAGRMVMTTDSHVVSPLFFPGGNIGSLAIHGTVNDLVMSGALPLYLSAGFILEEGFPLIALEEIVISMARAADFASVKIITGDTKVVERGKGDGVYINTSGVGIVPDGVHLSGSFAQVGDAILLSGSIGDHGTAVLSSRENLEFETEIISDSASLEGLVKIMIDKTPSIRCMRDPTRGGLACTLNELALQSGVGIAIEEKHIPIKPQVRAACELLGLDPLYIANEGKLVCICPAAAAEELCATMRSHPLGLDSQIIGLVTKDERCFVQMKTTLGGMRMVDWLAAEQLPRIC